MVRISQIKGLVSKDAVLLRRQGCQIRTFGFATEADKSKRQLLICFKVVSLAFELS